MKFLGLKNTAVRLIEPSEFDNFEFSDRLRDALVACRTIRHIEMSGFSVRAKII